MFIQWRLMWIRTELGAEADREDDTRFILESSEDTGEGEAEDKKRHFRTVQRLHTSMCLSSSYLEGL